MHIQHEIRPKQAVDLVTDDLDALLGVLPADLQEAWRAIDKRGSLVEIVLDLGRRPDARFMDGEVILREREITLDDIAYVAERVGDFGDDNRAGIPRTLHRISAIRNRSGKIVGLTLRVGRAVFGTVDIIRDIVESGSSILLLGRPGVGKTTMLRETARTLAEAKRVVIVDTSNEIAGDGDIPHPAIGRARRMQVPKPSLQHEVMIEAVENHNPEVIVIDEIGRELETAAARTIAERGVQLIATAHGNTLDNVMLNPTLSDLVGGLESVTLSDEEARRRGTQKSVLERRAPPTFDVVIEISGWDRLAIHGEVARRVDAILRGRPIPPEIRYRDDSGEVHREAATVGAPAEAAVLSALPHPGGQQPMALRTLRLYPYGVSQNRLRQAAKGLQLPVVIADEVEGADALMTLKAYYRKRPYPIAEAERRGVPVYVLRSNTLTQIEGALADAFGLEGRPIGADEAMRETQQAISDILRGHREAVELSPQTAHVRRLQHEMARRANLASTSHGREPRRRVRILRS
jgi:stage III sporulation protein SpoIIIAA